MRIGTWNMDGRGTPRHLAFLKALSCDVLLLTEVRHGLKLESGSLVRSEAMGARKDWAAVWTRQPASEREAEHAWSAAAEQDGVLVVSSILPWRLVGKHWPGSETTTAARTAAALEQIGPMLRPATGAVIFGGDFNQPFEGPDHVGSRGGLEAINKLLKELRLKVPTASLPHRASGLCSIDHITIPVGWSVNVKERVVAEDDRGRLSDHDAYVVDAAPAP